MIGGYYEKVDSSYFNRGFVFYCFRPANLPEVLVINIEVPVRVFKSGQFVTDLTISDFIIYENGKSQQIEAVYLVKKDNIQREEAARKTDETQKIFSPDVSRHFILLFELIDYLPKIDQALNYFFEHVISPEDTLSIVTPMKSYNFNKKALASLSRQKIAARLKEIIRRDINLRSHEYKRLIRDYESLFRSKPLSGETLFLLMEKIKLGILLISLKAWQVRNSYSFSTRKNCFHTLTYPLKPGHI